MTLSYRVGVATTAAVATNLLRTAGYEPTPTDTGLSASEVDCDLDWSGPVNLPLASELDVQAACGIMHVHGRKTGQPTPLTIEYASALSGVLAAQGVLAALLARARGLPLERVGTSVAQAALLSVMQYLAAATADDDWTEPLATGGPPFRTSDGVRFELETLDAADWHRFWTELGTDEGAIRCSWRPFQQRFATATCPLPMALGATTGRTPFARVQAAAAVAGVSVLRVRANGPDELDLPPWRLTPLPGAARATRGRVPDRLPLDGLVVVEAGSRVQGPLAGQLLRMLGATVLRIEPPGGDPMRGVPPMAGECSARFTALNRGKQSVELDLRHPAGRHAVRELVSDADVFLHNWAPGRAQRHELDAQHLTRQRPGLVYAHASGWGDALGNRPPIGTDYLVQAHSGLAALVGDPPAPSLMTVTDVLGGSVCALGVVAGLLARGRTGLGQRVDSSLLSATTVIPPTRPEGTSRIRPRTDLAALAADPRFDRVLDHDRCALVRSPWEFR